MLNLKNWRIGKNLTQGELAEKLSSNQKSYSAYETGRTVMPGDIQAKLRKLGYSGPLPHEKEALNPEADYITRAEHETLRADLEDACEVIRFLLTQLPEGSRPGVLPKRFR